MAEIRRQPFQTVKVDIEEMDRKIREHRIRMLKRAGIVLGILILLWFLLYIYIIRCGPMTVMRQK